MVERFLKQTTFVSTEDYNKNLQFIIPDNFNFAYDVMDAGRPKHQIKRPSFG